MSRAIVISVGVVILGVVLGCTAHPAAQTVMVPPRVDLTPHQMIGVMEFDSDSKGKLADLATHRFVEMARRDQGMLRMVDLGSGRRTLRTTGQKAWTPASYKAVGEEHGVRTVFLGELSVSNVRPNLSIAGVLGAGDVSGQVDATLNVQLVETETGASLWSCSARASKSIGHISVFRGKEFVFDAENPQEAYGVLIDALVDQVTDDFHAHWITR